MGKEVSDEPKPKKHLTQIQSRGNPNQANETISLQAVQYSFPVPCARTDTLRSRFHNSCLTTATSRNPQCNTVRIEMYHVCHLPRNKHEHPETRLCSLHALSRFLGRNICNKRRSHKQPHITKRMPKERPSKQATNWNLPQSRTFVPLCSPFRFPLMHCILCLTLINRE